MKSFLIAACVLCLALQAQTAQASSLQSLTLKLSDLPRGYALTSSHVWSNAAIAKHHVFTVAQLEKHGRIESYEVLYETRTPSLPLEIDVSVDQFRSAPGAHWLYAYDATHAARVTYYKQMFRPVKMRRVGNESTVYKVVYLQSSFRYITYFVYFRRGDY